MDLTVDKEPTDLELLRESLRQPASFASLVERYRAPLFKKALYILRNQDEAEDAVQETFVKIYLHAGAFVERPGASFNSWAYKILINTCFSRYQKLKREKQKIIKLDEPVLALLPSRDEDHFVDRLRLDYLLSRLALLPAALRRVMTLHFLEGLSYAEVAAAEGVSPGAVRTRIHRARRLLGQAAGDF